MKCRELMIGDWVHVKLIRTPIQVEGNFNGRVTLIDDLNSQIGVGNKWAFDCDEVEPIPLTPEIIAKFQDLKMPRKFGAYVKKLNFYNLGSSLQIVEAKEVTILHMRVRYVHELQHALRLCRIEKEIVI